MKKIHIRESLKVGWEVFLRRPWFLLGLSLAVIFLFVSVTMHSYALTALAYIIYGGYLGVMIRHDNQQPVVFDDLFSIDNRWISFAFLGVIKYTLIIIGLLLFVVPGVYLTIRWMFAELLVIDQGMRPIQALKMSGEMTKGNMWKLFLFGIVVSVMIVIGFLLLGVGALVASVVVTLSMMKLYQELRLS